MGSAWPLSSRHGRRHGLTTQVWVSNIDGSDPHKISECAGFPAWAPDSRRLALITGLRSDRRSGTLTTIDIDGGGRRQIVSWSGSTPTIAWNGEWIVYITSRINTRTTPITVSPPVLHVIRSDGTRARSLGTGSSPSFSPDGNRLAFVAWNPSARTRGVSLRVAQPDGRQSVPLDTAPDVRPYVWSPDGGAIAYARNGVQIYTLSVASGKRTQVTHEPASAVFYGIFWPRKDSVYYLRELTP
jgi:Tol biopolymer transport system component